MAGKSFQILAITFLNSNTECKKTKVKKYKKRGKFTL